MIDELHREYKDLATECRELRAEAGCALAEVDRLTTALREAERERDRYREALEWYAANCSGEGVSEREYRRTPGREVALKALTPAPQGDGDVTRE